MIPLPYRKAAAVFAAALMAVVVSALVLAGIGAAQQLADEGRARIPGTVQFEGAPRRYDVFVSRRVGQGSDTQELLSSRVDCEVTRNGEPLATLDGARQSTRTVTSFGASVGSFDGGRGRIAVSCGFARAADGRGVSNRFVVAKQRTLARNLALGGFGLAGLLVVIGLHLVRRAGREA